MVGTIRKNKREIPVEFNSKRKKSTIPYNMFGFKEGTTLVSHTSQKGKLVLLLSTMHHDDAIDHTTKEKNKPEITTYYNKTKGAVDVVDEMKGTYSVSRKTNHWPLVIFFSILNISGINA
ncbi:hypothetical protein NQ314_012059 [Rhamnusium bicolor]|uniref:PiggyBac transposable element-derived protein domain-containing protein n=2 Tax=Rhamnusium bicolor TaxID=1586634 RepID=A0AAV8XF68_9CUCU|nr:hypothetical protein NQ314_012059 [Rhamnusium bicolor]